MKKEKTVRTYQRRTKSGKMVTVREHKASYDAAEEARKAAAKKAGAGSELSKKKAAVEENPLGFSADDYKEWYHWDMEDDANNEAALRVEKALIKKMGKRAYNKYLEDMSNSYSARGHKKAHQALLDEYSAQQKKQDVESAKTAKNIARSAKEKAAETKASKVKTKENKSIKAPKNETQEQREARWNRGEFTDDEKSTAIMVYDLSGSKNNLHPKLSAWAKKEIKRMDDERAAKVDTKILKGLDRDVVSKLATLQGKKKLSKEDEAFIDKYVAPSGLIRGTKVSAFDAISAHKKDSKTQSSTTPKSKKDKDSDLVEHYDQFNKKYMGKAVGDSFTFSEGRGKDKVTYDARFVTDGKGRYGYVVRDKAEGPSAKYYVGISDGYDSHRQLPAGLRKAAEAQGITFKGGEFVKSSDKPSSAKTKKAEPKSKNGGSKKPLTSYQKHAINSLLNQPGWSMSKAEKYVRTLSDKDVKRLAHKDM